MAPSRQQEETRKYFHENAANWSETVKREVSRNVIVSKIRNQYILDLAERMENCRAILDVGCGSGDLIVAAAEQGITGTGIDFAPAMIEECERLATEKGVAEKTTFAVRSFQEYESKNSNFDVIAANGLIEYVSIEETAEFFDWCRETLPEFGRLAFSIRNRLFNTYSLNAFTERELQCGMAEALLRESIYLSSAPALDTLATYSGEASVESESFVHPETSGIEVAVRHMYTPVQLAKLLKASGLKLVDVYPCHIHASAPQLRKEDPQLHADLAMTLQERAEQFPHLVTQSSALMLQARVG